MNNLKNHELNHEDSEVILSTLELRFHQNPKRHPFLKWSDISSKLIQNPTKIWSLYQMEKSGGEPDILCLEEKTEKYLFFDCASESPKGRRSLCYDKKGLDERKEFKPENNVIDLASEMVVEILDESQYRFLQTFGEFDLKTSSWIKTPTAIRKLGGAFFGDRRFDHVFVYHNGTSSYYAARGFRAILEI